MPSQSYTSPNHNERDPALPLKYIVLHYTGMKTAEEALERLCDPASKVSAHYVVDDNGRLYNLVADERRAWHAGKSFWAGIEDINSASIGIELTNPGHQFGYRAFWPAQMIVLKQLLRDLIAGHKLDATTCLLAHSDVAPDRKEDPGELFPWQDLAEEGLGIWPKTTPADYGHAEDDEVQDMLRAVGYGCPNTGVYDRAMRAVVLAFQRRFEPENLTGTPERETIARLRALIRMQNKAFITAHPGISGNLRTI